jgi:hypothetical protein
MAAVEEDWPDEGLDPNRDEAPGQVAALDHPAASVMVHADHNGSCRSDWSPRVCSGQNGLSVRVA